MINKCSQRHRSSSAYRVRSLLGQRCLDRGRSTATTRVATLVSRINAAGAGVTRRVRQARPIAFSSPVESASEDQIDISDDDHRRSLLPPDLTSSNTELGNIPDDQQLLDKTTQFAGVRGRLVRGQRYCRSP